MAVRTAVRIHGAKELRAALKAMDPALAREVNKALREAVKPMASAAGAKAPRSTGRLSRSVRSGATNRGAFLVARTPYAGVQEYGGTIRFLTRAGQIRITAQPYLRPAIAEGTEQALDAIGDAFDALAMRHGFR